MLTFVYDATASTHIDDDNMYVTIGLAKLH